MVLWMAIDGELHALEADQAALVSVKRQSTFAACL
jgi:hypothetical protein